jgi:hypothetical protein
LPEAIFVKSRRHGRLCQHGIIAILRRAGVRPGILGAPDFGANIERFARHRADAFEKPSEFLTFSIVT